MIHYRSGQLEITGTDLILHRKGREPTYWPLKCLRRYGYDSDMFSFESGRRCTTGEGIYAFRCKRADILFRTLQDYLQRRAYLTEDHNTFSVPTNTNGPSVAPRIIRSNANNNGMSTITGNSVGAHTVGNHVTNRTILTVSQSMSPPIQNGTQVPTTDSSYLEPNQRQGQQSRFVTGNRIGSMSGGPISPDLGSPGSPNSFNNILEVTPLPNTTTNNNIHGISNLYQEFPVREFNNNKRILHDTPPTEPAPTIAMVPLMQEEEIRTYENTSPTSLKHSLSGVSAFSVGGGGLSDQTLPQEEPLHDYMNVALGETASSPTAKEEENSIVVRTPTTANSYGFKRTDSLANDPSRSYENMEPLLTRMRHSKPEIFSKVDLPATPTNVLTPTEKDEERTVNYIVLDLDNPSGPNNIINNNSESANECYSVCHLGSTGGIEHRRIGVLQYSNSFDSSLVISSSGLTGSNSLGLLPPESPKKPSPGYAMIDFNKTVALSNTVSNSVGSPGIGDHDGSEGSRRTRHS